MARRKAWAIASLGGLAAVIVGALLPAASPAGASTRTRGHAGLDPDVKAADDDSNGTFQSCSAYYGFGKSWARVQVKVDDEVDDDIHYPRDYELVLEGDLDPSSPGNEQCTPVRLTQGDWATHFPNVAPAYASVVPLPPGDVIVIPGLFTSTAAGSPLQLHLDGDFDDLRIDRDDATVPNFHDPAAFDAEYAAYLVATVGQPGATALLSTCGASPSPDQQAAAGALFAAMDPPFQAAFQSLSAGPPFSDCFVFNNLRQFARDYWFPYAWGVENPVTFELDPNKAVEPPAATPITPSAITFTG
jgi:hypothetical protein